jgi:hypothetical protein
MKRDNIEQLLKRLADKTDEPVSTGLAEQIKEQIPASLPVHKGRLGTINIIIDLRINKLTAAAAIILTMVLFAGLLSGPDSKGLYQDGKLVAEYLLADKNLQHYHLRTAICRYRYLVQQDAEVVFYGDVINFNDCNSIILQWKLENGNYGVMLSDLREKTVTADELIKLQSRMLRNKAR